MKRIGKIITAVGIGIMFFGGMCDADDIYYYYLIAVIALGALVSLWSCAEPSGGKHVFTLSADGTGWMRMWSLSIWTKK